MALLQKRESEIKEEIPEHFPGGKMLNNVLLLFPSLLVSSVVISRSSSECTPHGSRGTQHPSYWHEIWECQLLSGAWKSRLHSHPTWALLRDSRFLITSWMRFHPACYSPCCLLPCFDTSYPWDEGCRVQYWRSALWHPLVVRQLLSCCKCWMVDTSWHTCLKQEFIKIKIISYLRLNLKLSMSVTREFEFQ